MKAAMLLLLSLAALCSLTFAEKQDGDASIACKGGHTFTGTEGYIRSPNYGNGSYPEFTVCFWNIQLPANKYVSFTFNDMEIELEDRCTYDNVQIVQKNNIFGSYCGDVLPRSKTLYTGDTAGNPTFTVRFRSDGFNSYRGFEIYYSTSDVRPSCAPGLFECSNGDCVNAARCNHRAECLDGSDEEDCGLPVSPGVCGVPEFDPDLTSLDRIIGGSASVPHSWPFTVSLQSPNIFPAGHVCGAAIINSRWIVTAAHCILGQAASSFHVVLGAHNIFETKGRVTRNVEKTCSHPNFPTSVNQDIALIKLKANVDFGVTILPVCTPNQELPVGSTVYTLGWGKTYGSGNADVLKQVPSAILSRDDCRNSSRVPDENAYCVGHAFGSSCFGDSGGPLVYRSNGKWALHGVVSGGPRECGKKDDFSVYTKVVRMLNWIDTVVREDELNVSNPTCRGNKWQL